MVVKITPNDQGNPPGKLADAELQFTEGVLTGLRLIGFAVWEQRNGTGRNVTFPARQYAVNGERRSFAPRPITDASAQEPVRDLVLEAFAEYEQEAARAASSEAKRFPDAALWRRPGCPTERADHDGQENDDDARQQRIGDSAIEPYRVCHSPCHNSALAAGEYSNFRKESARRTGRFPQLVAAGPGGP